MSEIFYRYRPKLRAYNEKLTDQLVGLKDARKTRWFDLCFLHLCNIKGIRGTTLNRPEVTGYRYSCRIARYETDTKEEDREAIFTRYLLAHVYLRARGLKPRSTWGRADLQGAAVRPFCYPAGELHSDSVERAPIISGIPLHVILNWHRAVQSQRTL
jgi:hypothetical protein